jgi:molybdopterin-guanine dinucleotide biosynthesis protein MobB
VTALAVSIVGPSGSGKTTLAAALIALLAARGLRVVAIKHASHGFQFDREGKDSQRLRAAGAAVVAVVGPDEHGIVAAGGGLETAVRLVRSLGDEADVVLVEGFHDLGLPAIRLEESARPEPAAVAERIMGWLAERSP